MHASTVLYLRGKPLFVLVLEGIFLHWQYSNDKLKLRSVGIVLVNAGSRTPCVPRQGIRLLPDSIHHVRANLSHID